MSLRGPGLILIVAWALGGAALTAAAASAAEAERGVSVARAVGGVVRVESGLGTGQAGPAPSAAASRPQPRRPPADVEEIAAGRGSDRRLIAVGASVGWTRPRAGSLQSAMQLRPLVRLGSGRGLGVAVGLGWFGADVRPSGPEGDRIGHARIRPVMGGLSYTLRGDRKSVSFSLVGGPAFNGAALDDKINEHRVLVDVGNSFAWRSEVSLWFDVGTRSALNVSAGYLVTRPQATFLEDGHVSRRTLNASALVVQVGMAYQLF